MPARMTGAVPLAARARIWMSRPPRQPMRQASDDGAVDVRMDPKTVSLVREMQQTLEREGLLPTTSDVAADSAFVEILIDFARASPPWERMWRWRRNRDARRVLAPFRGRIRAELPIPDHPWVSEDDTMRLLLRNI